jgi:hypothetical protein
LAWVRIGSAYANLRVACGLKSSAVLAVLGLMSGVRLESFPARGMETHFGLPTTGLAGNTQSNL